MSTHCLILLQHLYNNTDIVNCGYYIEKSKLGPDDIRMLDGLVRYEPTNPVDAVRAKSLAKLYVWLGVHESESCLKDYPELKDGESKWRKPYLDCVSGWNLDDDTNPSVNRIFVIKRSVLVSGKRKREDEVCTLCQDNGCESNRVDPSAVCLVDPSTDLCKCCVDGGLYECVDGGKVQECVKDENGECKYCGDK